MRFKVLNLFTLFGLILNSQLVCAQYSGVWRGDGNLTGKEGKIFYCEEFEIVVDQQKDKFVFGKFRYTCGGFSLVFTPPVLAIKEQKNVYWKDQFVGELGEKKTQLIFKLENGGTPTYTVELLDASAMKYQDAQIFPDGSQIIDAILYKIQ